MIAANARKSTAAEEDRMADTVARVLVGVVAVGILAVAAPASAKEEEYTARLKRDVARCEARVRDRASEGILKRMSGTTASR